MDEIVKICKIHGELTIDKVYIKRRSKYKYIGYDCKTCASERSKIYRKKNIEIIKMLHKNNAKTLRFKLCRKKLKNKNRINLTDYYIKQLLVKHTDIKVKEIPKELIEIKRLQIKLQRIYKESKNGNNKC